MNSAEKYNMFYNQGVQSTKILAIQQTQMNTPQNITYCVEVIVELKKDEQIEKLQPFFAGVFQAVQVISGFI